MSAAHTRFLVPGLVAGAIGYAVVVAFFTIIDLAQGRSPFFTAAVLGSALLGLPSTTISAAPVAVYNGLHLLVFLALGEAAAWLASVVQRRPQLWYLLLSLAVFTFFHLFGAVAGLAAPGGAISLPLVLVAGLLAVIAMGAWLWRAYPELGREVRAVGDFDDPPSERRPAEPAP